jgi:hypothetical protein
METQSLTFIPNNELEESSRSFNSTKSSLSFSIVVAKSKSLVVKPPAS